MAILLWLNKNLTQSVQGDHDPNNIQDCGLIIFIRECINDDADSTNDTINKTGFFAKRP